MPETVLYPAARKPFTYTCAGSSAQSPANAAASIGGVGTPVSIEPSGPGLVASALASANPVSEPASYVAPGPASSKLPSGAFSETPEVGIPEPPKRSPEEGSPEPELVGVPDV